MGGLTWKRGDATKDYTSEARGRGGSLWSQTTSTMVPLDPADLPSPSTDATLQARRDLPLYARCGTNAPAGARRPRNLFLRGTNFICGENVTSPQDHSSAGTPLNAAGRPRELSFSLHQAVIHEASPAVRDSRSKHSKDNNYLDMSLQRSAWRSPSDGLPAREYVNLEPRVCIQASNTPSLSDKEREGSGYLPMGGEWKDREREGEEGRSSPTTSVGLAGCKVKAKGPAEGATQVTSSSPGITSHSVLASDGDDPLPGSSSHLETCGNAVASTTQSRHDGSRRTRREKTDDTDTPPCCPETPPRRGETRESPE